MSTIHRFGFPAPLIVGPGARAQVAEFLKSNGLSRPLIVTDRGIAALPMLQDMVGRLSSAGLKPGVFSEVWGNPLESQVTAGACASAKHQADSIIGLGGGAALDVAKAVALMSTRPGSVLEYEAGKPGARLVEGDVVPWVAIPTTSGTGSEIGRSAVISDEKTHVKKVIFSPKFLVRAVFADPELTVELPAKVTATTGMDALTHCVESYLSNVYHPICDGIALEGARLAARNLAECIRNPRNIESRQAMMMASLMGGIAFQKDLGVVHSCAHALGAVTDMHHGLANGIMITYGMKFNLPAVSERLKDLATIVGVAHPSAEAFIRWLEALKSQIGIPRTLSDAGVGRDKLPQLVILAIDDGCHPTNPRPCTIESFQQIFTEAF